MTLVKICGITNLDDALGCVAAGADALGFNFFAHSPRYIAPEKAGEIIDRVPKEVLAVGVFVNEAAPEDIARMVSTSHVAAIQLHGEESPQFCDELANHFVIKVFRARHRSELPSLTDYRVSAVMLDGFAPNLWGGTGRTTDWELARRVKESVPKLFLAGGLSPENVAAAILAVEPYAVDACSALEVRPGIKDLKIVERFVRVSHLGAS
jgi:phosphoribosylanthranilate isomerase